MDDPSILSTILMIFVPAIILTAIIVWSDSIQQKKEKDWQMRHHH